MADGVSFNMFTAGFHRAMADRQARMPGAGMYAVREAGRIVKATARAKAPVLKDSSTLSHQKLQRFKKAGFNTTAAYSGNRPIPGLLKASITPTKNIRRHGLGEYSIKIGPRGERVHLYAAKIEARAHYMAEGHAAGKAALKEIAERAFGKVWRGR